MPACKVCLSDQHLSPFEARDQMFGTPGPYRYYECKKCGSLQIAEIPADLAKHYPPEYYSFSTKNPKRRFGLTVALRRMRAKAILRDAKVSGLVGGVWEWVEWMGVAGIKITDSILDVGCGRGILLQKLASVGFTNLQGADPFLKEDVSYPELNIRVYKREARDMEGTYRCVILSHSLEHMPEPTGALRDCAKVTAPGGVMLVAIPVAGGYGWRTYGTYWYGMDCPRHLVIPSEKGMRILAERVGLKTERVIYYGGPELIAKTELHQRGMLLEGENSIRKVNLEQEFGVEKYEEFRRRAKMSNQNGEGDVGVFLLRKPA